MHQGGQGLDKKQRLRIQHHWPILQNKILCGGRRQNLPHYSNMGDNVRALSQAYIHNLPIISIFQHRGRGSRRRDMTFAPPLAQESVPFASHLLGLARSKFDYFAQLR